MTTPADFFYEHAGYSYMPDIETPEQAKRRCADELANAEQWAQEHGVTFSWSDDWTVGDHHDFYGEAYDNGEPSTCEQVVAYDRQGRAVASLGCVDDADVNYRRVIEAELASDAQADHQACQQTWTADLLRSVGVAS